MNKVGIYDLTINQITCDITSLTQLDQSDTTWHTFFAFCVCPPLFFWWPRNRKKPSFEVKRHSRNDPFPLQVRTSNLPFSLDGKLFGQALSKLQNFMKIQHAGWMRHVSVENYKFLE